MVPVTKNLGLIEWVVNTKPLKYLYEKEMPTYQSSIIDNIAFRKRINFLKKHSPKEHHNDIRKLHHCLLELPRDKILEEFEKEEKSFPRNLLQSSLRKMASSADYYIKLRTKFLKNYSVLSLCGYILGVGDRHLDNFLFNYKKGDILTIDFGYSFGFAVGLYVPELMPFRLTQNIQELCHPLGINGIYRNSMIYTLKALRICKNNLLDCCEVFVKDPLIDWIKLAKQKDKGFQQGNINQVEIGEEDDMEKLSWYPRKKIDIVEQKLRGVLCTEILIEELKDTKHGGEKYFDNLKSVVNGVQGNVRWEMKGSGVGTIGDQVDCLIDLSQDPNVLGRAWSLWSPFA